MNNVADKRCNNNHAYFFDSLVKKTIVVGDVISEKGALLFRVPFGYRDLQFVH